MDIGAYFELLEVRSHGGYVRSACSGIPAFVLRQRRRERGLSVFSADS